jgi:hypothetical protein
MYCVEDWIDVKQFNVSEFNLYLEYLTEDEKAKQIEIYGKNKALELLKKDMCKYDCFYTFVKDFSPIDYKVMNRVQYVSQRVITKHVELWNDLHHKKLKSLRIFFI